MVFEKYCSDSPDSDCRHFNHLVSATVHIDIFPSGRGDIQPVLSWIFILVEQTIGVEK